MAQIKTDPQGEFIFAHQEIVERVNQAMPPEETLFDLAELFKVFGDSTRIKILYVLFESEMCVYDIAQLLGMTQSAISHQLQVLKKSTRFLAKVWSTSPSDLLFLLQAASAGKAPAAILGRRI